MLISDILLSSNSNELQNVFDFCSSKPNRNTETELWRVERSNCITLPGRGRPQQASTSKTVPPSWGIGGGNNFRMENGAEDKDQGWCGFAFSSSWGHWDHLGWHRVLQCLYPGTFFLKWRMLPEERNVRDYCLGTDKHQV